MHGRIFVGTADRGLYALRAGDGATLWRFETLGAVQCEPLYDPQFDIVYFGSHDGALYAVQATRRVASLALQPAPRSAVSPSSVARRVDALRRQRRRPALCARARHRQAALDGAPDAGARHGDRRARGSRGRRRRASTWRSPTATSSRTTRRTAPSAGRRWTSRPRRSRAQGDAPRYLDVDTTPMSTTSRAAGSSTSRATRGASSRSSQERRAGLDEREGRRGDRALALATSHAPMRPRCTPRGGALPSVPAKRILIASSGSAGSGGSIRPPGASSGACRCRKVASRRQRRSRERCWSGPRSYGLFLCRRSTAVPSTGSTSGPASPRRRPTYGNRAFIMSNAGTFLGVAWTIPGRRRCARETVAPAAEPLDSDPSIDRIRGIMSTER